VLEGFDGPGLQSRVTLQTTRGGTAISLWAEISRDEIEVAAICPHSRKLQFPRVGRNRRSQPSQAKRRIGMGGGKGLGC